jgi:membrane protein YqaA with SNARE-associated domain
MRALSVSRHNIAAFAWGLAEATFFFIVPDVLLSYIGLKQRSRAAAIASLYAAVGAGVGGALMFMWSAGNADAARRAVLAVPAISDAMAARAADAMADNWFLATLLGPLTSTPFKVYAILAPHAGAELGAFALAGVVARLPRFLIVSMGVALIGRLLTPRVDPKVQTWLFVGTWLAFYAVFFASMPN